jgi:hypothetical protein
MSSPIRCYTRVPKGAPATVEVYENSPLRHLLVRATRQEGDAPYWLADVYCLTASNYIPKQFQMNDMPPSALTVMLTALLRGILLMDSEKAPSEKEPS